MLDAKIIVCFWTVPTLSLEMLFGEQTNCATVGQYMYLHGHTDSSFWHTLEADCELRDFSDFV